ncbi:MAG: 3-oxoacyl-ACP synthase [Rhodobacteraceae bacterium]|nr:3-oxoacyl-ACP synthase [Paracoccaceae bacterium]OUU62546.1 MAG: hypothetical protein CBC22_04485 [Alphaproteobacteria bacterium TMED62]|tara:strand:- start:12317 stop:13243 length:927 start_codon:yes stop_codon:yes gene_type:complete
MVTIISSHYELGQKKESLKELCHLNKDWDYERLLLKTGIKFRHILGDNETPESLSIKAGRKCIEKSINKDIDGIIYVTQSPSLPLPTRACHLQDKLGIKKNSLAFDINQGCSGFVYALSTATALIKNDNASRILIICADHYSKYISKQDRTSRPIFSDAAAAIIIERSSSTKIGPFVFKTSGDGGQFLTVNEKKNKLYMDGPAVLKFSLNLVPEATHELLDKANYKMEDIDTFIFHQASAVVLNKLKKKLNIEDMKWFNEIENIGNTVSATIPIAINILQNNNKFPDNKKYLLMGFGVGLSVAGCIIS